ncbi:MAG TPA: cupredoxin domain-containing protein [Candidatus Paceibacterota bacterium]
MKITAISILVAAILIGGAIVIVGSNQDSNGITPPTENNVNVIDGKQIIEINAKGGYSPRVTTAQAGMPTVIKVNTRGTFDCSSALVIPSLGYRKNLPPSGETIIDVPLQASGSVLQGLCAMGMYNFQVRFE